MRKRIAMLLSCLIIFIAGQSQQNGRLLGQVRDTLEKRNLENAVVSLIRKSDSVLTYFTRADQDGKFTFPDLRPDSFTLLVTYPRFADYADNVSIGAGETQNTGIIPLTLKSIVLNEVIVRAAAIRQKGDTTEYNASMFKVKEGATVEDLLKVMPGFTVNSKGEITAQGKSVDKVLVDGEEFFGDDPTIATQNIGAKAVDKVQVYDTKTEQQDLTGITGGNEGKTINIKLKDDAKKGAFGKAEVGSNFDRYLNGKLMYNHFQGKKKMSVFGTKSNTSTGSLGWDEQRKLGMEDDFEYDEIGDFYYSFGSDDGFNDWNLKGLPNAYSAGALYSNKWNEERQNFNGSYRFNRLGTNNVTTTLSQTLLEDTIYYDNNRTESKGLAQQHLINAKYEWKIDSLISIKLNTIGTYRTNDKYDSTYSEAFNQVGNGVEDPVNTRQQRNDFKSTKKQIDNKLTYRQQFRKKGRLLLANLRYSVVDDHQDGLLYARSDFYESGAIDSTDITDQMKLNTGLSKTFGSKFTYNEPLNAKWNLVLDYSYNQNNAESRRNTYEKDGNEKYTVINNVYSNNFDLVASSHTGTVTFRMIDQKWRLAFGSGLSSVKLNLLNRDDSHRDIYNFLRVTPQAQVSYSFNPQKRISINYNGRTVQPQLNQLQPIRDNNDPLNVFVGNPDLKVGFNHRINLNYNSYQVLSGRYLYMYSGMNIQSKAITNVSQIDVYGKRTYSPVNVDGNYNWYFGGGLNSGRKEGKLGFMLQMNANGGQNTNFINARENVTRYGSVSMSPGVNIFKTDKYSFRLAPRLTRNLTSSSLRKDVNNNYWSYGGEINSSVNLPLNVEIRSDIEFDLREEISAFAAGTNTNIINWNAEINKKIFKDKSGKIIFEARDILNQNKGFTRNINSNFISDQRFQRVGQYFMLTFQWTFNKMPGGAK